MWGENLTNYGGIGKFSFMGKKRVRDLFVARNQKHFSSGLSRYETESQPYMLTAFKYSGCRQNDQVLPPCFKIGLNPQELTVYDGSPILPYFSHNSKHEVFPRNDPDRTDKDTREPILSTRNREALKDYYKYLYEMPFYSSTFPDHIGKPEDTYMCFDEKNQSVKKCPEQCCGANATSKSIQTNQTMNNDEYSRMVPLLAKLCMLSKHSQASYFTEGTPIKRLLVSYVEDLSTCFSAAGYEELNKVVQALCMFSASSGARDMGIDLSEYPLITMANILERQGTSLEKVLKLRALLRISPKQTSGSLCTITEEQGIVPLTDAGNSNLGIQRQHSPGKTQLYKQLDVDNTNRSPSPMVQNIQPDTNHLHKTPENIHLYVKNKIEHCNNASSSFIKPEYYQPTGYHHPAMFRETCPNVKKPEVLGTSPCWPPSTSYSLDLRTMQLKSTGSLPQSTPRSTTTKNLPDVKRRPLSAKPLETDPHLQRILSNPASQRVETVNNTSLYSPGLVEYKDYLYSMLPVSFDERGLVKEPLPEVPERFIPPIAEEGKENYVGYDKLGRKTFLPPIPLSECLPASGDRIQDRLGLRFKTEAHRRFHAMYPDSIPDLRDNFNFRKRHFFRGYHTSVMR